MISREEIRWGIMSYLISTATKADLDPQSNRIIERAEQLYEWVMRPTVVASAGEPAKAPKKQKQP